MAKASFEYDVAFSLLKEDEHLAHEIISHFKGRLKTFLYSEEQFDLTSANGVAKFSNVFKSKARIVVVLFRTKWGRSGWTAIEQNSITDRMVKEGHNFLIMIPLEKQLPEWYPDSLIYLNFEKHDAKQIASIIEYKFQEARKLN